MKLFIKGHPLEMVATIIAPSIPGLLDAIYQRGLDEGLIEGKSYQDLIDSLHVSIKPYGIIV
jgi:hypothetical protein